MTVTVIQTSINKNSLVVTTILSNLKLVYMHLMHTNINSFSTISLLWSDRKILDLGMSVYKLMQINHDRSHNKQAHILIDNWTGSNFDAIKMK